MKITRILATLGLFALLPFSAFAEDAAFSVDPNHTRIGFMVRHLGIAKVRGKFNEFTATVKADPATGKVSSVEATAQAKTVDTDNEKRDNHLRSDDFFNAAKFPALKLKSKAIKWDGNKVTAEMDLTIRDVTKPVQFKGELLGAQVVDFGSGKQKRAAYELRATINRKDFGLKFNGLAEGVAIVADPVDIEIEIEIYHAL